MDINLSINVIIYNHQLATGLSASIISSVLPTNLSVADGGQMHRLGAVNVKMSFVLRITSDYPLYIQCGVNRTVIR